MTDVVLIDKQSQDSRKNGMPRMIRDLGPDLPEILEIAPGYFLMGEQPDDKFANNTERPSHMVHISTSFGLGRYPVTVREYAEFDGRAYDEQEADLPVVGVSWFDAMAYCEFASKRSGRMVRLPSEAEWEYACRAGTNTSFPSGEDITPGYANYWYDESGNKVGPGKVTPVGSYPPNAFGLYDMNGNVCEWVQDEWHESQQGAPTDGSAWSGGAIAEYRVLRGGAWDYLPRLLRNCWRDFLEPHVRRDNVGFRIAVTLNHG